MTDALPELWVGAECTINRVGDRWRDQAVLTGFRYRTDDFDRLASLGATRVRLPVLWEHIQPSEGVEPDFSWPDHALRRIRALGMRAIVGLLHHGSGPAVTSLVDARFPERFAQYARRVAERYPEQDWWTPINEPLTTARFSCLYGVWYPHHRDDRSFVRALIHQVQATLLAMRAIREVNPRARLIQTDDLGYTRSTPALAEQADFDNHRRWLAYDLLAGRVDSHHVLWDWLRACGAQEKELQQLVETPCPPDVTGINAYVTSERFLDDRLNLHPAHLHGGNGRDRYVDIETVRVQGGLIDGFEARLREAHARYQLPVAITEVHLGCTREEQMRWFHQAWQAAARARSAGVDVLGVTAWAAFGTVDWNSLLAREAGHYEPGLWDIRGRAPRLTALGRLVSGLARGEAELHPALASPGWWHRDIRHMVVPHGDVAASPMRGRPLLILGAGALARAFERLCHMRGLRTERLDGVPENDLGDLIASMGAWAIIDASRWDEPLAGTLKRLRERSDSVPWLTVSRADACDFQATARGNLVVCASDLFGPWDADDRVVRGATRLRQGEDWTIEDNVVCPTYIPDLVQASLDLLIDGETGVWPLNHGEVLGDAEFARRIATCVGADPEKVWPLAAARAPARRPAGCSLMPSLADAVSRFAQDHRNPGCS